MDHRLIINRVKTVRSEPYFTYNNHQNTTRCHVQLSAQKILVCQENHGSVSTETICCKDKSNTNTNMIRLKKYI